MNRSPSPPRQKKSRLSQPHPVAEYLDTFSPIKRQILITVHLSPGINRETLSKIAGNTKGDQNLYTHVAQINRRLEDIGAAVRIRGSRYGGYRLVAAPRQETNPAGGGSKSSNWDFRWPNIVTKSQADRDCRAVNRQFMEYWKNLELTECWKRINET
jgi:hypothetical protein